MDVKDIRELIEIIKRSDFETFELEREGFRLKLVKGNVAPPGGTEAARQVVLPAPAAPPQAGPTPAVDESVDEDLIVVESPIVGTYYESPSPDAAPFVSVGAKVRKGQVLCIVEAMKLMNEIESEVDAEVVEIVAANGQPVEYGESLFKLRPV